jgi:hypoxanthine phosphoribosyltransferase
VEPEAGCVTLESKLKGKLKRVVWKKGGAKRKAASPPDFGDGVVLSPQSELPRHPLGQDRSRARTSFRELTWQRFDTLVQELARAIQEGFGPDAVVGVAHGGVFVGGAVARALRCDFYPVRISRRSRDRVVRSTPRVFGEMPKELKGKRVVVVDDVAASGDTLELAQALAKKVGVRELATACLVAREGGYQPRWAAITTDELVVFPWDYEALFVESPGTFAAASAAGAEDAPPAGGPPRKRR